MKRVNAFKQPAKITQNWIDKMVFPEDPSRPKAKDLWVRDPEKPGLYIVFRKSGVHSYVFKATVPCLGKPDPFSIGKTQTMTLQYARLYTNKCYEALSQGLNPRYSVTGVTKPENVRLVKDIFEDFIASMKKRGRSPFTIRNHRHSFNRYMPNELKNNVLSSLTRTEIENCVDKITHTQAANKFILNLRAFLNWCIARNLLPENGNFVKRIELCQSRSPQKQKYGMMPPREEEIFKETLYELVKNSQGQRGQTRTYRGALMVSLLYWLGCRPRELFLMKKNQIFEWENNHWFIKLFGKGGTDRVIPLMDLPSWLLEELKALGATKEGDDIIWSWTSDTTGKQVLNKTWLKKVLPLYRQKLKERNIVENNPLQIPYDLRHHSQTKWYMDGGNHEHCAQWHGNSVPVAKKYYVNPTPDQQIKHWMETKTPRLETLSIPGSSNPALTEDRGEIWAQNGKPEPTGLTKNFQPLSIHKKTS